MCGIVGYVGNNQAAPVLLDGLAKLEYRGYDSAGICVSNGSDTQVVKVKGRLKNLAAKTENGALTPGNCGIGHTRWATHGVPSENNAHPHTSSDATVIGVHNGIIENYVELREKLIRHGYVFHTETDTEVALNLVDYYYKKYKVGPIDALAKTMVRVRGSYALAVMFKDHPGQIYAARKDSPMIVGYSDGSAYLASDVPAILKYTRDVYYIGNLEMACLEGSGVTFYDLNGDAQEKEQVHITWDAEAAEKDGYEHFMMKEIHEEPKAVGDTLNSVMSFGHLDLSPVGLSDETIRKVRQIYIVACGSAYHVGAVAQYIFEEMARIPVRVEYASEFRYRKPILDPEGLAIIISQSGETADTLAGLRECRAQGVRTLGIVNVVGSSIAREADNVFYTLAGPEIAVATTKAYSAQLMACYSLAVQFSKVRGTITEEQYGSYISELSSISGKIAAILEQKEELQRLAAELVGTDDIFYIGRGIDYAIGMEGSLKMKEISYIHSEAYAAGELKHGTISLIEPGTPVVGILTQKDILEKTVSNMVEVKARGGRLLAIAMENDELAENVAETVIRIPNIDPHFAASLAVIPLQLLGYYVSVSRGLDVDKPRNLAKSVTVE